MVSDEARMGAVVSAALLVAAIAASSTACDDARSAQRAEPISGVAIPPTLRAARIVELGAIGNAELAPRAVRLRLPAGVAPDEELPVLIVLDGQAAFTDFSLEGALDALERNGVAGRWAVLTVASTTDRERELAEEPERFAAFVLDDLLPRVRRVHPLSRARDRIAVLGFSYGGLAAVRMQLARPTEIGRVIAMSPSVWWDGVELPERLRDATGPLPRRLWIDVGTAEDQGIVPGMVRGARALRDAARARGLRLGAELGYLEEPGARHVPMAVAARCLAALAFALGDTDLSEATPTWLSIYVFGSRNGHRTTYAVTGTFDEGRYRLTLPPDHVRIDAPAALALDDATLRAIAGEEIIARYRGVEARLRL